MILDQLIEKIFILEPFHKYFENSKFSNINRYTTPGTLKLLYLLHPYGGGTEHHVIGLVKGLDPAQFQCYIVKPKYFGFELLHVHNNQIKRYLFQNGYKWKNSDFYSESNRIFLKKLLNELNIDIIHIQHLIGHSMDIFDVAAEKGIPVIITLHDYYSVCPRIYLINQKNVYCTNLNDINTCNACLSELNLEEGFCSQWRQQLERIFKTSKYIIAPSKSVFDIITRYYSISPDKLMVIEPGVDSTLINNQEVSDYEKSIMFKEIINIAYIGVMIGQKGEDIFYKLAKSFYSKPVRWHIIGYDNKIINKGFNPDKNVNITGKYKSTQELIDLVKKLEIDLTVFPSICPETYSFTLTESWSCGIPALVSNIGALEERVRESMGGWAVYPDVDHFKEKIDDILSHPQEYEDVQKNLRKVKLKTMNEMLKNYENLYFDIYNSKEFSKQIIGKHPK